MSTTSEKLKALFVMSILKVDYLAVTLFRISYSLEPKIEIFLKYFLDKKFPTTAIVLDN